MSNVLGIEHPLILFKDLDEAIARFKALGFSTTAVGRHPWGTSMSLAQFDRCSIELMSIYDEALIDERPAGDFRFGRYMRDRLREREGMSLVALFSEDAERDETVLRDRGIAVNGTIEFGRPVTLPDGREGRTATTLKTLFDPDLPRVSHFICHQHRPEFIWVPEWLTHPNGAHGIAQVTYFAPEPDAVRPRFSGLYGESAIAPSDGGMTVRTGNGTFEILDEPGVERRFGRLPDAIREAGEPCGVAISVKVDDVENVTQRMRHSGVAHIVRDGSARIQRPEAYGNVWLEFVTSER
jgi:Glyoxalase-like domain